MRRTRLVASLVVGSMLFSLAGCSKKDDKKKNADNEDVIAVAEDFAEAVIERNTKKIYKLCDEDAPDSIGDIVNYSSYLEGYGDLTEVYYGILDSVTFEVDEDSVDVDGDNAEIKVIFNIPEYEEVAADSDNTVDVDTYIAALEDADTHQFKFKLNLEREDDEWVIINYYKFYVTYLEEFDDSYYINDAFMNTDIPDMIDKASSVSTQVIFGDPSYYISADCIVDGYDADSLAAHIISLLDYESNYDEDTAAIYRFIDNYTYAEVAEATANVSGGEGTVIVMFHQLDVESVFTNPDNMTSRDTCIEALASAPQNVVPVEVSLVKIDGEWYVTNINDVVDAAYDYLTHEVVLTAVEVPATPTPTEEPAEPTEAPEEPTETPTEAPEAPTDTPVPSVTNTPTPTNTNTPTPTATNTPTPTPAPTNSPTPAAGQNYTYNLAWWYYDIIDQGTCYYANSTMIDLDLVADDTIRAFYTVTYGGYILYQSDVIESDRIEGYWDELHGAVMDYDTGCLAAGEYTIGFYTEDGALIDCDTCWVMYVDDGRGEDEFEPTEGYDGQFSLTTTWLDPYSDFAMSISDAGTVYGQRGWGWWDFNNGQILEDGAYAMGDRIQYSCLLTPDADTSRSIYYAYYYCPTANLDDMESEPCTAEYITPTHYSDGYYYDINLNVEAQPGYYYLIVADDSTLSTSHFFAYCGVYTD